MTQSPQAGWYPDPQQSGVDRWWDGMAWTVHQRATAAPVQPVAPALPAAGWYPDPEYRGSAGWWTGAAWSEHRSPAQS